MPTNVDKVVIKHKEQPVQDESDGLLFFHGHSLWETLQAVEKFYECTIYGVLELQEVEEYLSEFCDMDTSKYSKKTILNAIDYAYNKVDSASEYEIYMDRVIDYLNGVKFERE